MNQLHTAATNGKVGETLLDRVLAYENDGLVRRLMEKMNLGLEAAESLFDDTKRFLYMVGTHPGKSFGPPETIDEAWHHFILFTREYAAFCHNNFGCFIHHLPNTSALFVESPATMTGTFEVARTLFGELSANWAKNAGSCVGGSCSSDCTQCGGSTNCQSDISH